MTKIQSPNNHQYPITNNQTSVKGLILFGHWLLFDYCYLVFGYLRYLFRISSFLLLLSIFFSCSSYAQENAVDYKAEYEKLKKEHEALFVDYDNVLAQVKILLEYKRKAGEMEDSLRQFDMEKEQWSQSQAGILNQLKDYEQKIKHLDERIIQLTQERGDYKKSFEKASVENIIGAQAQKKIAELEKDKVDLGLVVEELRYRRKGLEEQLLKKQAETELAVRQLGEAKSKYEEARRQNRTLENKLEDMPKKYAELARENKVLIKRTGLMHYNLGVFYTQNREFVRAVAEFDKAVELNPQDSSAHFNLGYIYAEHLQNRSKAVGYFRQFLKLAKRDDKDADWVKRYILTWQTWEGKVPIK